MGPAMKTILRSNDPVEISFVQALMAEADIPVIVLDAFTSAMEGSIGAIPRRLAVIDEDFAEASRLLTEAGLSLPTEGWWP